MVKVKVDNRQTNKHTPGNVKNRFDLELFGSWEINTIYTSLHEHSQNHPILLSLHFHSELLECLQRATSSGTKVRTIVTKVKVATS